MVRRGEEVRSLRATKKTFCRKKGERRTQKWKSPASDLFCEIFAPPSG
jgi:hypothetical protein